MERDIVIHNKVVLSNQKYLLQKVTFSYKTKEGGKVTKTNEVYNPGNAVTVFLFNKEKRKIILTKQFRLPSYMNGNEDGMLIEACAGKTDGENPDVAIKREIKEETGFEVPEVEKIFEAYMTPGAVTEKLCFYVAAYDDSMRKTAGGGLKEEQEHVEVLEMSFDDAMLMLKAGDIKDAKTIMLLQYANMNRLL